MRTLTTLILSLILFSCTMSKVTPEQEKQIVGTYKILITDEIRSKYTDEEINSVELKMETRRKFFMPENNFIKGSNNGEWLLFSETSTPYFSFHFNTGKQEQATYSENFDTIVFINPRPTKRGKELKELIFIKE